MQRLIIAGRVGKDAELRQTQSGDPVLGFTVAVDNGKDKPASWYDVAIWGKRATIVESHIRKGLAITVIGRPTVRVHDGKAYLGISADDWTYQGGGNREGNGDAGGYQTPPTAGAKGVNDLDDSIPFAAQVL